MTEFYRLPSTELLTKGETQTKTPDSDEMAESLSSVFTAFGVGARVTGYVRGATVTRYVVQVSPGTSVKKIEGLRKDIALTVGTDDVRLISPIEGENAMGIEIPNTKRGMVQLRDVLESIEDEKTTLTGLGQDIEGNYITGDIAKWPHILVAGATGSGKSVFINTLIVSLIMRSSPDETKLILVDPKQVEMTPYEGLPHLARPIITDPTEAAYALSKVAEEMDARYARLKDGGVRNIKEYNKGVANGEIDGNPMTRIVVVIDEMADLMMVAGKFVEKMIVRIAQLARAAGIHLVMATQRPTANVITGLIKANAPTRLSFSVASGIDSRVILDQNGAQDLLGMGDSLYSPAGSSSPVRVQGAWINDDDINAVVNHWKQEMVRIDSQATDEPVTPEQPEPVPVEPAQPAQPAQPKPDVVDGVPVAHLPFMRPGTAPELPAEPVPVAESTQAVSDAPEPTQSHTEPLDVTPDVELRPVLRRQKNDDESKKDTRLIKVDIDWLLIFRVIAQVFLAVIIGCLTLGALFIEAMCGTRGMMGEGMFTNLRGNQFFGSMDGGGGSQMGSSQGRRQTNINDAPSNGNGINADVLSDFGD